MKFPPRKSAKTAGFVISLEFLLVMSLVVLPLMLGLMLVGRKLITAYLTQLEVFEQPFSRPVVWDSSDPTPLVAPYTNKPIGAVIGYDEFAAPQVLYRDNTAPFAAGSFKPGVLLGVRSRRFTTVSRVYYVGDATCGANGGVAYVKSSDASLGPWPYVSFLSQLQGINYAMGRENILWREPTVPGLGAPEAVGSVWTSENAGDASPEGLPSTACAALTAPDNNLNLRLAAEAADLNANFVRPFRLAFASPTP